MKILMVCLGNICRSPLAHGIMQSKIDALGLDWIVDSAGTGDWHVGEAPDSRAISEAKKNGIDIGYQKARNFTPKDFHLFDVILAMDTQNYNDILKIAPTEALKSKVQMIMNFASPNKNIPVPDPYYDNRFGLVFDMLTEAVDKFIEASKMSTSYSQG
jgi:protein-tyrosine phosphatase